MSCEGADLSSSSVLLAGEVAAVEPVSAGENRHL